MTMRDEKLDRMMRWAEETVARIRALPPIDENPEPQCPRCGQIGCLGPRVAANRGGCRMDTWADVG